MKTKIKITIMLMAMIIGTLAANAQSTSRSEQRTKVQKATTQRGSSYKKKPAKNERGATAYRKPANTNRGNTVHQQSRTQKPNTTVQTRTRQHKSTTNRYNPQSNYRKPNSTVHVGKTNVDPKSKNRPNNNNKVYQGNSKLPHNANTTTHYNNARNHKHYYYPVDRVKIHVHPMTYRGNYRALYYPGQYDIYWSRSMRRHYVSMYPGYTGWHYHYGYRIQTMSVFDARYNINEVARVYGRVYATWFNHETDDLLLFFGGEYPNQVFTMVIPGKIARRYSWRPERYFLGEHIAVTGLITMFEGNPEMVVKRKSQIDVY